jgi:hypothetical protein
MDILIELKSIREIPGHFVEHYSSIGNNLDTGSIICFIAAVCQWSYVLTKQDAFSSLIQPRFDVYADLVSTVHVLKANQDGMHEMLEFFSAAEALTVQMASLWEAIRFVFILAILRILKYLNFQERLSVVTRTIQDALVDLFHFIILFVIVVGSYTVLGWVAFGGVIQGFSSVADSFNSCFALLMGDLGVSGDLFGHPNSTVAYLVFYSYLVIVFFYPVERSTCHSRRCLRGSEK